MVVQQHHYSSSCASNKRTGTKDSPDIYSFTACVPLAWSLLAVYQLLPSLRVTNHSLVWSQPLALGS